MNTNPRDYNEIVRDLKFDGSRHSAANGPQDFGTTILDYPPGHPAHADFMNTLLKKNYKQDDVAPSTSSTSTSGMTFGDKIKAAIPGTKEHRAKKEMERDHNLNGQPNEVKSGMTTGEKIKSVIPGTKEHNLKKENETEATDQPNRVDHPVDNKNNYASNKINPTSGIIEEDVEHKNLDKSGYQGSVVTNSNEKLKSDLPGTNDGTFRSLDQRANRTTTKQE